MTWLRRWFGSQRSRPVDYATLTSHLVLDLDAESARPDRPAFMAPPDGAPPYHGFKVLDDVSVDGFTLGAITDFMQEPGLEKGDAFVVAPDGARAGVEWHLADETFMYEMAPFTPRRWGVWMVGFTHPMVDLDSARANLESVAELMREKWLAWRRLFGVS